MLKYSQVIEIHSTLFGGARVADRWQNEAGEMVTDWYDTATPDELLSVLVALGCEFDEALHWGPHGV